MKRQHCRQLWPCPWLKTDKSHRLRPPTPRPFELLLFLHGSDGINTPTDTPDPARLVRSLQEHITVDLAADNLTSFYPGVAAMH